MKKFVDIKIKKIETTQSGSCGQLHAIKYEINGKIMYLLKRDISKKALTRLYNQLRGYGVRIRDIDCSKSQKSSAMKEEILSQLREMCQTIEREKKICEDITEADARRVFNYQVSQYLNKKEKGLTESDIFLLIEQNKELSEDYPNPTPKFMEMQNELFNCLFERFKVSD